MLTTFVIQISLKDAREVLKNFQEICFIIVTLPLGNNYPFWHGLSLLNYYFFVINVNIMLFSPILDPIYNNYILFFLKMQAFQYTVSWLLSNYVVFSF